MRFSLTPTLLALCLLWVSSAQAQWLIYELKFTPDEAESVNFSNYRSAYMVAPAQGGAATFILTTDEGGRYYAVAECSAKFFLAANVQQKRAAFSALALSGNSQALYTASGLLNRSLVLDLPNGKERVVFVAETLQGRMLCADDESDKGPASDGSIGVIGNALIQGTLREDLTSIASKHFTAQNLAVAYVVELLEKYGYSPDEGSAPLAIQVETIQEDGSVINPILFPAEARPQATTPEK